MAQDSILQKDIVADIAFFFHILVILPAVSFFFLALSLIRLSSLLTAGGIIVIWIALIPYPVWWYWQRRISR